MLRAVTWFYSASSSCMVGINSVSTLRFTLIGNDEEALNRVVLCYIMMLKLFC